MAYEEILNMSATETAIEYAVLLLSRQRDTFTYEDIADVCRCSPRSIHRAMPQLIETGCITRSGTRRTGFRYELGEKALMYAEL